MAASSRTPNKASNTPASMKTKTMPLAIIGLSCRFPGEATDALRLWDMVASQRNAWSEIPEDRFNKDAFYHPNSDHVGTHNVRGAHFLKEDVATWDASFFNFTAEAARAMDPQFRLLMETTFEALESAGLSVESIAGSNTSVYAGAFFRDYESSFIRDAENLPRFFMTGTGSAMASNRISHFFDLRGPSMTVDTGCSTALTALHLACQSVRAGESSTAIVGGANLILNPDMFISMSNLGLLGPSGKCFSFDSRAEGFGRGEGIATIIIKSLDDAIRDRDPIRAVIRETALNQDGKTQTITSPSQEAQEAIIRQCYHNAGLDPGDTSYVEAHGTGTKTGDPIEANAIGRVFGQNRDSNLFVGSVKSNIGHLESSSGLAAIIKVVMAFEQGFIPPSINFESPNPGIDLEALKLKVPTKLEKWPENGLQRASVSNFGYGGTNTHVIMEHPRYLVPGYKESKAQENSAKTNGATVNGAKVNGTNGASNGTNGAIANGFHEHTEARRLYVVSAKDKAALQSRVDTLRAHLESRSPGPEELADIAYTLGQRRSRFDWTTTVTARTSNELVLKLQEDATPIKFNNPRLGFVFTGQGAQWHAMGRELIMAYPVFLTLLQEADDYIKELGAPWSLLEELGRDEKSSRVNEPALAFPVSVALQVSLVRLLDSWAIRPAAVTGHSSGEISAAFAAGAVSLREALAIAYVRGAITQKHVDTSELRGRMLAVGLGAGEAQEYLQQISSGQAVVACVNSPSSVTLSGDVDAIEQLEARFKDQSVFARQLKVQAAYHSHHMAPLTRDYLAELTKHVKAGVRTFKNDVTFSSPVTGEIVHDATDLGPRHWAENMVQPVLFSQCLQEMVKPQNSNQPGQAVDILVEVGPHSALAGPIRQILASPQCSGLNITYNTCLSRRIDAVESAHSLASNLLSHGYPVEIEAINFPHGTASVHVIPDLPSYPWNHSVRYWQEPISNQQMRQRKSPPHDLLGVLAKENNKLSPTWRHIIRAADVPWIRDHCVQSKVLYPAAGCISMVIEAKRQLHLDDEDEIEQYLMRDVEILRAMVIDEALEVHLSLKKCNDDHLDSASWDEFHIYSVTAKDGWIEHSKGFVSIKLRSSTGKSSRIPTPLVPNAESFCLARRTTPLEFFESLRAVGIEHGPAFQNIHETLSRRGEAIATFQIADIRRLMPSQHMEDHIVHPTTLDSLFQMGYASMTKAERAVVGTPVPRSIRSIHLSAELSSDAGHVFQTYGKLLGYNSQGCDVDISVFDSVGDMRFAKPLIQLSGVHYQSLGRGAEDETAEKLCFKMEWKPYLDMINNERVAKSLVPKLDASEAALIGDLRRATYIYIHDALQVITEADVARFEWHQKILYDWMLRTRDEANQDKLGRRSSRWAKISPGVKQMLLDKVSAASSNGRALRVIGQHLVEILRGELAPLDLLMQDKLLHVLYETMLRVNRSLKQITDLVKLFAHKNPRAKVLEIGAGTGSGTVAALKALGGGDSGISTRFAQYDFTDISAGFFPDAREKFAAWGQLMKFEKLDVEQDPTDQGFEDETYDLIIAVQCLHATKSMTRTMSHVRRLLKPGGKLIMMETTQDSLDVQLIFGTLPGWWLSEEPERKDSPNLRLDMWERVLKESGFSGIDFETKDCDDARDYSLSVIMATATPEQQPEIPYPELAVVYTQPPPPASWLESVVSTVAASTSQQPITGDLQHIDARDKFCIFIGEVNQSLLHDMSPPEFDALTKMILQCKGLIYVSRGGAIESTKPQGAMHIGLLRALRLEYVNKPLISLDLDPKTGPWTPATTSAILDVLRLTIQTSPSLTFVDNEFALRDGSMVVPRIQEDTDYDRLSPSKTETELQPFSQPGRELRLEVGTEGLLDSLRFTDVVHQQSGDLAANLVEIEAMAFGLNFRDVMVAMGGLQEKVMGFECSGVVTRIGSDAADKHPGLRIGDRVMALIPGGGWANLVRVPWTQVCRVPDAMTFEEAASVPVVWVTVWHSLVTAGQLRKGESILIHAATGGVGQAAILLAQHLGADIYCTVSTPEKRDMLTDTYGIPASHIFSSRDVSFADDVLKATNGRGVNVVLNSLAGPLLEASWKCVARFGRFLEIGKRDIQANKSLPMRVFQEAVSFAAIDVIHLMNDRGEVVFEALTQVMDLLDKGSIRAVTPITKYTISDIQSAFRKMQAGQHRGKIVVVPSPGDRVPVLPKRLVAKLSADATYLFVGGLQGLGQAIAQWAVEKGAKNLIIMSRNVASSPEAIAIANQLGKDGCQVKLCNCDVADWNRVTKDLAEVQKGMPPIRGVVQGAVILDDAPFESMTLDQWNTANRPKVQATLNLHHLLIDHTLDFFIMLSSVVSCVGNALQTNYAAGSAFQDAFALCQRARGLPYTTIDIGVVRSLGRAARAKGVVEYLTRSGLRAIGVEDVLDVLDYAICSLDRREKEPEKGPFNEFEEPRSQIITGPASYTSIGGVQWRSDAKFIALQRLQAGSSGTGSAHKNSNTSHGEFSTLMSDCTSFNSAVAIVCTALAKKLSDMFMRPETDFDTAQPLDKYGVDSLVAIELRNWLVAVTKADVSLFEVLQSKSLADLAQVTSAKSAVVKAAGFEA